jgi:hypothetical protein
MDGDVMATDGLDRMWQQTFKGVLKRKNIEIKKRNSYTLILFYTAVTLLASYFVSTILQVVLLANLYLPFVFSVLVPTVLLAAAAIVNKTKVDNRNIYRVNDREITGKDRKELIKWLIKLDERVKNYIGPSLSPSASEIERAKFLCKYSDPLVGLIEQLDRDLPKCLRDELNEQSSISKEIDDRQDEVSKKIANEPEVESEFDEFSESEMD